MHEKLQIALITHTTQTEWESWNRLIEYAIEHLDNEQIDDLEVKQLIDDIDNAMCF